VGNTSVLISESKLVAGIWEGVMVSKEKYGGHTQNSICRGPCEEKLKRGVETKEAGLRGSLGFPERRGDAIKYIPHKKRRLGGDRKGGNN